MNIVIFLVSLLVFPTWIHAQSDSVKDPSPSMSDATKKTLLIRDIGIKSGLRNKAQFEKIKNKYIGLPDSPDAEKSLIAELTEYLASIGYPHARTKVSKDIRRSNMEYTILISPGKPCIVQKISSKIKLPPDIELKLNAGMVCDREFIHEQLDLYQKRLEDEGFQNSTLDFQSSTLSEDLLSMHLILDGHIGIRVNFEFIDESSLFISNPLDEETSDYFKKNYSDPLLVKQQLFEYFKNRGFEFVSIRGPLLQIEDDKSHTYLYYINPNSRYEITDLVMEGSYDIPVSELKDATINSSLLEIFSANDSKNLEQIKNKIADFYKSRGYWDAKVIKANIDHSTKTKTATLHVTLDEGKQRILSKFSVDGNTQIPSSELMEILNIKEGKALGSSDISNIEFKIREKYFNCGYLKSEIRTEIQSKELDNVLETEISVHIYEGPLVYIGSLSIQGLIDTKEYVVRRELLFKEGDVYKQADINKSRSALFNLGLFTSVFIEFSEIKNTSQRSEVDVTIKVRESDAGRIKFGPGYNFYRGLQYVTESSYNNLWGTGRRISLRAGISQEKNQQSIQDSSDKNGKTLLGRKAGATYTEPYVFNLPITGNFSVLHQAIADDIWKISNSVEVSVSHTFNGDILQGTVTPFYRYELLNDEGTPQQKDSLLTTGFSRIASLGLRYRLDKRNNLSFPTRGFLFSTELGWARYSLLSQYRYFKWRVNNSYYKGLFSNFAFAINTNLTSYVNTHRKGSSIENIDVLPASDRLLAGGPNDVRGFDQQLGPYVYTTNSAVPYQEPPLGGTQLLVIKSELRYQISPDLFSMSLFWDFGNSFFTEQERQTFSKRFASTNTSQTTHSLEDNFDYHFEDILTHPDLLLSKNYHSIGISAGLLTPLGAINASVGWPVFEPRSVNCRVHNICNPREKDKSQWIQKAVLDFNIGAEF